jgi:hypothetical protein
MKPKNIEVIQRALGIIEGVMFGVKEPMSTGLATAVEMIDEVMKEESEVDTE